MKITRLSCLFCCCVFANVLLAQSSRDLIRINQLGYYPHAAKIAVVASDFRTDEYAGSSLQFFVLKEGTSDTVFKAPLGPVRQSGNSALKTRMLDFSSYQGTGLFTIYIPGLGVSYPFRIGEHVHKPAAVAVLKGFYYQRASMPLDEKWAGKWHRPAGHPDTAVLVHPSAAGPGRPAGTKIPTPGGWYDAGDYNKYMVNSGISTGTLLSSYEDFPAYFDRLETNIPESGNGVPDILDEALYNIRWMLSMQDPGDGGVYNKCTNAAFDGMVRPGVTKLPRYVVQKGTAATLDFAAVAAQAGRLFKPYGKQYPKLADSCLRAAARAWEWSLLHPATEYNQNSMNQQFEPKVTTGAYGDRSFGDEWFWAAAELLASTGDKKYFDTVARHAAQPLQLPSWGNVHTLGVYTLARMKNLPAFAAGVREQMRKQVVVLADGYLSGIAENAFGVVMGSTKNEFNWGSNSNAANQGIALVNAWLITKERKYAEAALTNLDYLLGRNATGYSFVTGIGTHPPMRPHHRPSISDGIDDPVPGLLAGGPNPGMQDHAFYERTAPETAYSDTDASYASNEIAINWNAPAVYLFNAIEAMEW